MKNIIFISIDSLTSSRLGYNNHEPSPTPKIDMLEKDSLVFDKCFTSGTVTQFAFPSIMTSTYPLDYGGYDEGITHRPVSFPELLEDAGYNTGALVSVWWLDKMFGYDRGIQDFYSLGNLPQIFEDMSDLYVNYFKRKESSQHSAESILSPMISSIIQRMPELCAEHININDDFEPEPQHLMRNADLADLRSLFENEVNKFNNNNGYISDLISGEIQDVFEMAKGLYDQPTQTPPYQIPKSTILKINMNIIEKNFNKIYQSKELPKQISKTILGPFFQQIGYAQPTRRPSAAWMFNHASDWINGVADSPFFLWIHLMDVHDKNFVSWDMYDQPLVEEDLKDAEQYVEQISQSPEWSGNLYYDLSIRYTDRQIQYFVQELKERSILDNTVIVVHSDHGGPSKWPYRSAGAHDFYDERQHIPALFYNLEHTGSIKGLTSSIDIAPTLLGGLDLQIPHSFKGRDFTSEATTGRDFIISEHLGRGPCDFENKAINTCLRTPDKKIVSNTEMITGYWNLSEDPEEKINLIDHNSSLQSEIRSLIEIIRNRQQFLNH